VSDIRIFDAERAKAESLARLLGAKNSIVTESVEAALDGAIGLVNGTPVGMLPDRRMPVSDTLLHAGLWVADAVYWPLFTPLLLAAKAKGCRIMTGRELAICQALDAFELFTGREASIEVMGEAFDRIIAARRDVTSAA
jgi:quinate/shikimate dehydrogenase (NAD+)